MPKSSSIVFAASIYTISTGLVAMTVGAFLLQRLDKHMYEHPVDFYDLARRYGSITSAGALLCFAGCIGLAIGLDYKKGFSAGVAAAVIGLATTVFGLALFPIHEASGAVYFVLIGLMFSASLVFLIIASVRYVWFRTHSIH